jgi:hypothetical protein
MNVQFTYDHQKRIDQVAGRWELLPFEMHILPSELATDVRFVPTSAVRNAEINCERQAIAKSCLSNDEGSTGYSRER